jgi:hypothetical protein
LRENTRRRCHVINTIFGTCLLLFQQCIQLLKIRLIIIASPQVKKPGCKILPFLFGVFERGELLQPFFKMHAEFIVRKGRAAISNNAKLLGHAIFAA